MAAFARFARILKPSHGPNLNQVSVVPSESSYGYLVIRIAGKLPQGSARAFQNASTDKCQKCLIFSIFPEIVLR